MAKGKIIPRARATGWTTYSSGNHTVVLSDGEIIPFSYHDPRPATKAEIAAEQAKREARDAERREIDAFRARPEWQDADSIRSAIEMMDHENHPLDKLTPEEWQALRIKICGW
jgi:hypothetical protein